MSSNFSFGKINVASKKQVLKLDLVDDPLLVDYSTRFASYNFVVTILVDRYYNQFQLKAIDEFLKKSGISKYIMLCTINCHISKDQIKSDQKSGVIEFYINNCSKFRDYLQLGTPIITSGPALYSLLKEEDVYPSHVQQAIFGKTYFWFSLNCTSNGNWVYPIESFEDLFNGTYDKPIDSFKTNLAKLQFQTVLKHNNRPVPRYPKLNKIFIETVEDFNKLFYEPNKHRKGEVLAWDIETSGFSCFKDRIGCITLSFDGVTGYYCKWSAVDKDRLNEILNNNIQLGTNLKFDIKFLWTPSIGPKTIEGYALIEMDGHKYKVYNSQLIQTKRGQIVGRDLQEEDEILNLDELEEVS